MVKVPFMDRFFYLIFCFLSLGFVYLLKLIILNALVENENAKIYYAHNRMTS